MNQKICYELITSDSLKTFYYEAKCARDAIEAHVYKHYKVFDADNSGSDRFFVAIRVKNSGAITYYSVVYSWVIDYNPEWELVDNTDIEMVSREETQNLHEFRIYGFRDWLVL